MQIFHIVKPLNIQCKELESKKKNIKKNRCEPGGNNKSQITTRYKRKNITVLIVYTFDQN